MILKLIWKETRENLWKGVILTIVAVAGVLFVRHRDGYYAQDCAPWLLMASSVATVWVAASTAASERSAGSLDVLFALPVRPLLLFAIKTSVGLATLLLPFVVALITIHFEFPDPFNQNSLDACLGAIAIPAPLYFAILAIAAKARQESRAAMIGVLTLLGALAWGLAIVLIEDPETPWYLMVPNPLFVLFDRPNVDATQMIPVQIFITLFWICIAAVRFLRTASNTGTGSEERPLPLTRTLLTPLPHPALLWKEIREQFSVFAIAFWSAAGIAIISALVQIVEAARRGGRASFLDIYGMMLQIMLIAGAVIPLLISIVLGVGAFAGDLDERLLHFWQGQPIPIHRWFWTKYLVSAAGILVLLVVPLSIAVGGSTLFDFTDHGGGTDSAATHFREQARIAFLIVIVIAPFAHALSIFLTSIIRRTMYATITTVILLILIAALPPFAGLNLGQILTDPNQPWQTVLLLFCASLLLASLLLLTARTLLSHNWRLA